MKELTDAVKINESRYQAEEGTRRDEVRGKGKEEWTKRGAIETRDVEISLP